MGMVAAVSRGPVQGFQCTSVFIIPWALTVPLLLLPVFRKHAGKLKNASQHKAAWPEGRGAWSGSQCCAPPSPVPGSFRAHACSLLRLTTLVPRTPRLTFPATLAWMAVAVAWCKQPRRGGA